MRFGATGTHTLRVQTREDGVQIDQIVLSPSAYLSVAPGQATDDATIVSPSAPASSLPPAKTTPYSGTPAPIPGAILLQDFDNGGEGVAYHDTTAGNAGAAYRQTGVDLQASTDGGNNLGWAVAGEWVSYTVTVASSGTYTVTFRVASAGQGGTFHLEMNGTNVTGPVAIPNTGGWQTWTSVTKSVTLAAGTQVARLVMDANGATGSVGNVNSMKFSGEGSSAGGGSDPTPYSGSPVAIPGTIQAENFDNGGEGTSYHDTTPDNSGGQYRSTGVDLEAAAGGGYNVGWTAAGEWMNYSVNVGTAGGYTVQLRVAAPGSGGSLQVGFNGPTSVWAPVSIPATGGWQKWTTVNLPVTLGAGRQVMTLLVNAAGFNLDSITVVAGSSSTPSAPPPVPPTTTGTLRVITWNIHSGNNASGSYVLPQQVQYMAAQNADVLLLQEVSIWNEDQPAKLRALLQQATGRTWYPSWAPSCSSGGCLGNLILSRIPIVSSSMVFSTPTAFARAQITVGGLPVQIFANHLDAYDTSVRTRELNHLMQWARSFGGPRLVAGDFNAWWGEWWILQMQTEYLDTWQEFTGTRENGYTIGNVRFDYIFRSLEGRDHLVPTNVYVGSTSLSDHRPVVADFRVQ